MEELVPFLKDCLERKPVPADEWLVVIGWAAGNEPSERYRNMRMALDAVSDTRPIVLWSSHSAAFNSAAFAQARDLEGRVVGMNRETLPTVYADYQEMVSVDETGEPTGKVVEDARDFIRDTVFEDVMGLNEAGGLRHAGSGNDTGAVRHYLHPGPHVGGAHPGDV